MPKGKKNKKHRRSKIKMRERAYIIEVVGVHLTICR